MTTTINLRLTQTDRNDIRKYLIGEFLDETPGTGTGTNASKYIYVVENLSDEKRIELRRPAYLNNGMDFQVHVPDVIFNVRSNRNMPNHASIIVDLEEKQRQNSEMFNHVKALIDRIYNCEIISASDCNHIQYSCGHNIDVIMMSIKWLFIEQDVTYWNYSGRTKLYNALRESVY
ncbi:MAG: hypothetical protein BWY28_01356 [bacterium ADurb.Bin236]|nr:MAG: hypothetical protein BWY28_01356 [bacterium ADurb.Bin236]HPN94524.1 hypothetical protein [bacterium]